MIRRACLALVSLLFLVLAIPSPALAQAPQPASAPAPPDGTVGVPVLTLLEWTAGSGSTSHDVHFEGAFRGTQSGTTFDPGPLEYATSYYWRIDETNGSGTTTGRVWCFETEPDPAVTRVTFVDPPPGSVLSGPTATFRWDHNGLPVVDSWLYVGPERGSYLYYDNQEVTNVADFVDELPTDGRDVWVRLEYEIAGEPCCRWDDARYTAPLLSPDLVSPPPGSVLPPGPVTFTWDAFGAPVTLWYIEAGYIHGGYDYESSGDILPDVTSWQISGLPEDGGEIWVRMWYEIGGEWSLKDHRYYAANATDLVRRPYLQSLSPRRVVVRWRTKGATDSVVRFGPAPGDLGRSVANPALTTEHDVVLDGLEPDTTYSYAVGSSSATLAGDDPDHFFHTPPPAGVSRPATVWVLGDSGSGGDSQSGGGQARARAVRDAFLAHMAGRTPDLVLMLGDNAYFDGTDNEFQKAVFEMYPSVLRSAPLWPAIGNHEAEFDVYRATFELPAYAESGGLPSGTEFYYSFDRGNVHFVCLDSMYADRSPSGPMLTWLAADLAATDQHWLIAYWHHPPYSKGSHDSDDDPREIEMRQNVLPILEGHGVDLVLSGHSHSYERSFLLDGHYGKSNTLTPAMILDAGDGREEGDGAYTKRAQTPHDGAVYAVAGSSSLVGSGSFDHPAMLVSIQALGSMILETDGDRLDALFLRETGLVQDSFTILKPLPPCAAPGAVTGLKALRRGADVALQWDEDPAAVGGYRVYRTAEKILVPVARRGTAGVEAVGVTRADPADAQIVDAGAVDVADSRYYQVLGLCSDGATEGPK